MKAITCPPLCGISLSVRGDPVQWGLVEYIQDFLLPDALGSVESCNAIIRIGEALAGLRNAEQVGKVLTFEDGDHALLRALATKSRQGLSPENLVAVAICNRAIFLAESAPATRAEP